MAKSPTQIIENAVRDITSVAVAPVAKSKAQDVLRTAFTDLLDYVEGRMPPTEEYLPEDKLYENCRKDGWNAYQRNSVFVLHDIKSEITKGV